MKSTVEWHLCKDGEPTEDGTYLVSSLRNPGHTFTSRYYTPKIWNDGKRTEGGWSLKHPRGERVRIYCWAEIPEAPCHFKPVKNCRNK